ncbi:MAG: NADH-quinone oxidoreductase subunit N [Acidimicrobiales bacterium]
MMVVGQVQPPLEIPSIDWSAAAPLLVVVGGALLIMVLAALLPREPFRGAWAWLTVLIGLGTAGSAVPLWRDVAGPDGQPFTVLNDALLIDGFAVFFIFVLAASVVLTALFTEGYQRREDLEGVEPYVLTLLSASGGMIMATAIDLIVIFLGLEILSIAVYVLAASHLRRIDSQEAGMKYFILGAFSSAFFLYGIALIYGATGSTHLSVIFTATIRPELASAFGGDLPPLFLAGLGLLLVGFGFKIAAVPFHVWTPDVYQGSPSPAVAYMASGVKAAGFAGLLRVFTLALGPYQEDWQPLVYGLAIITLVVGAVLAVVQTNVKRMLAYSSISHAGFILLGVEAASRDGVAGSLFYLAAYTFMVAGSFGVVSLVGRRGDARHQLDDYRGLARSEPVLAITFTVFLLAQAGVPLTAGFFAKFYVLRAAIDAGSWPLALVAMLSAVIAAFLYLRIIVSMYMGEEAAEEEGEALEEPFVPVVGPKIRLPAAAGIGLGVAVVFTLAVGFLPSWVADLSDDASFDVPPAREAEAQE